MNATACRSARQACEDALALMNAPTARAAMVTIIDRRARREAELSDERKKQGTERSSLDGMPIVWKDLFDIVGTVTTCGSASQRASPTARRDSALVRRARQLGMVTVGKTNLSEFAFSGLGINRAFGTPVNPLDPDRIPGGSSSGAATAVAAGVIPLAIGTDTSGSVRVPAAFTGCVGFRASYQRYGRNDFRPLSPTLDSVGLIARTVDVIREFDSLAATVVDRDDVSLPPRVIVPAGEWVDGCTSGVRAAFGDAVRRMRDDGVVVVTAELPSLREAQRVMDENATIVGADAYRRYGHLLADGTGIEAATRRRLACNVGKDREVGIVRAAMAGLRRLFAAELNGALLICPTVRHEPPTVDARMRSDELYDEINTSTLRTTMVLSYLGTCGISLPIRDLPIGVLVSAPAGCDRRLLACASRMMDAVAARASGAD